MTRTRIAIIGAAGRMGRALLRLAEGDARLELAGAVTVAGDPLIGTPASVLAGGASATALASGRFRVQLAQGLLARADHHMVDFEQSRLAVHADVQAKVIDALVLDSGDHLDLPVLECEPEHPAGSLSKSGADP